MKKFLALAAGLALVVSGANVANADSTDRQLLTTGEATFKAVPDGTAYAVLLERAVTAKLAPLVIHRGADAQANKLAIVKIPRDQITRYSAELPMLGQNFDDGTPKGGFVTFDTEAEAKAFMAPSRSIQQLNANYTIDQQSKVKPLLNEVNATNILNTIKYLSKTWPNRYTKTKNAVKAANWIKSQYESLSSGKSYTSTEFYNGCTGCGAPVVMHTIKGTDLPDEYVVIGGHYDSIVGKDVDYNENTVAPGADDNATSQATMFETLRILYKNDWRPKRTVVFFSYPAEEIGLLGSKAASEWFKSQNKNVVAHVGIDMTNYVPSDKQRDITYVSDNTNNTLNQHLIKLVGEYIPKWKIGAWRCGYQCSDHAPWNNQGYPSAMVSEPSINPALHTPKDTIETMGNTAEPSVKFVQLALAYLVETAKTSNASEKPTTKPTTGKPVGNELQKGKSVTVSADKDAYYSVKVPNGAKKISITISGGSGEADMYVAANKKPDLDNYDCRPYVYGNDETCTFDNGSGTYQIMLHPDPSFKDIALVADWNS